MYSLSSRNNQSWLSWFLRGILILMFLALIGKSFEVQVIKGSYYRTLSEENRIRHIPIPAPRGKILAKNGEALADNTAIKKTVMFEGGGNVKFSDDLTNANPEEIITDYKRIYPLGSKFGHASGYIAPIAAADVGTVNPECPEKGVRQIGKFVGLSGLEEEYECQLEGISGEKLIEVDIHGKKLRTLAIKNPIPGFNIQTSIDYNLQQTVADALESAKFDAKDVIKNGNSKKGAAIVTNLDGQILAFYSAPSYDPNLFINRNDPVALNSLFNNQDLPLFDRVISGTFHPGSVFKPVVALAALEEGAIDRSYTYTDTGAITVNGFTYNNWYFSEYGRTEGQINLVKALARSTDTFFYKIGEITGPTNLAKWADNFNLDKKTGIDIPGEQSGLIPTPEWKQKAKKESWFLGNTYNMSIGQGDVATTPLEINNYIQALAGYGKYCPSRFMLNARGVNCNQIKVDQKNVDFIKEGMVSACKEGGTAFTFFDFPDKHNGQIVACKTGTAEVGTDGTPHAWFTIFSPVEKPEIVLTVLIEKGGQGSSVAGPVARKIMDYYYDNK